MARFRPSFQSALVVVIFFSLVFWACAGDSTSAAESPGVLASLQAKLEATLLAGELPVWLAGLVSLFVGVKATTSALGVPSSFGDYLGVEAASALVINIAKELKSSCSSLALSAFITFIESAQQMLLVVGPTDRPICA